MALQTIALAFAFIRSNRHRVSDPEKDSASSTDRDLGTVPVRVVEDGHTGPDGDDGDDNDAIAEPVESNSRPRTNNQLHDLDPPERLSLPARVKSFIFPPSSDDDSFVPNYRHTPLISGIVIPFSILLEIPGLTGFWYISTQGSTIVDTRPNPAILDVGLGISMACAVIANICLIMRFLEKWVTTMTLLCILFLSIHDIINIVAVTIFGVVHRFNDGFTYGEAFWMTVCSTVVSLITNVTLIIDFIRTPNFKTSGSGLTRRQRTLMIILILLFIYIALGSLINSFLLSLTFINGLYFTVTTIETIGFGDITPNSTGSRIFVCFYAVFGIINVAVVVGMVLETVREGFNMSYLRSLREIRARRQATLKRKRAEKRWRSAVIWRLREKGESVWVRDHDFYRSRPLLEKVRKTFGAKTEIPHSMKHRRGMRLNLEALTHSQLEAAAMEAGVPLDTLLPPSFYQSQMKNEEDEYAGDLESARARWSISHPVYGANMNRERRTLTDQRLGAMAMLLTRFTVLFVEGYDGVVPQATTGNLSNPLGITSGDDDQGADSSTTFTTTPSSDDVNKDYLLMVEDMEKHAFCLRIGFASSLFFVFWMVGAVIFSQTEGWSFGISVYFCFIAFTTIGYGDISPQTPAGRSVFVVWALIGVGAMSVFVSVASEAYSKRYKGMLENSAFGRAVTQYRNQMKQKKFIQAWSQVASLPKDQDLTSIQSRDPPAPQNVQFKSRLLSPSVRPRRRATIPLEMDAGSGESSQRPLEGVQDAEVGAEDPDMRVRRLLEALPRQVLDEAHTFHEYMRLLGKCDADDSAGSASDRYALNERLRALLDDVVRTEGMKESVKVDILKDKENMRTLVMLSIEKSLIELTRLAEGAIAAINNHDCTDAALQTRRGDVVHDAVEAPVRI